MRKLCHHEPTLIYTDKNGNIEYYAADEDGVDSFTGDLVVNLTKSPSTKTVATTFKIPQLAKHMKPMPEEIVLGWEDFEMPPVKPTFWKALHNYCKSKGYHKVCFRCIHGHGRTGTGLSAMMIANLGTDAESAILTVRNEYCQMAVESAKQIVYLLELDSELNDVEFPLEEDLDSILHDFLVKPNIVAAKIQNNDETW